ncbi:hypothetical protein [Candidatus Thiodictyon syntrophicum]|uniref:Uncharacterized protein n=1 Tax=Candidatus Thiodictyon syntrophicum TaxID=1166950 RepID=A0A2K8UE06_9GAMM|nr:hypothetical protein [Candidatus Thiodictyon syntrophicum]AUB83828.1 hypothetical protein THSYN_24690 [Candidatus Thiodictyon syntrophicum]
MTNRIRSILEQLEQVREDLLALSDDIWQSIDHNDSQALDEGVAFKKEYNAKMAAFDQLAGELSALVQQFTAVKLDDPVTAIPARPPRGQPGRARGGRAHSQAQQPLTDARRC